MERGAMIIPVQLYAATATPCSIVLHVPAAHTHAKPASAMMRGVWAQANKLCAFGADAIVAVADFEPSALHMMMSPGPKLKKLSGQLKAGDH